MGTALLKQEETLVNSPPPPPPPGHLFPPTVIMEQYSVQCYTLTKPVRPLGYVHQHILGLETSHDNITTELYWPGFPLSSNTVEDFTQCNVSK